MVDKLEKNKCTGCKSCGDICPKKAISFESDENGFWHPKIDKEKCIECGLCEKVCPSISGEKNTNVTQPKVYACWNNDKKIRENSTSGGIFWALGECVINRGGIVVGATYTNDCKNVIHSIAKTKKELEKMMGSKYLQSDTKKIYSSVKNLLKENKLVLFSGTPCQISALNLFLGKEYENLITVDFICRGINSPLAYQKHIEELENKYSSKLKSIQFKNKIKGWRSLGTLYKFENGKTILLDRDHSLWMRGYVEGGLFLRSSCYSCKFKGFPRVADISFGDFWGQNKTKEPTDLKLGISAVLINSQKGHVLFENIKNILTVYESSVEELLKGNICITDSVKENPARTKFFKLLKQKSFSYSVKHAMKEKFARKLKRRAKIIYISLFKKRSY